ncbi:hypothetical protein DVH24_032771 [Malus domestica]|uniref:Uncharacterized protein n=1 Tax=Malus domestica TaxID=3750 RepID=A0A498IR00_MALDO|nr:hypothetical protein DVH24_032771 [Malus domestica]
MSNQSNEKGIFTMNVSILDVAENSVDGVEIPAARELLEKSRVRRLLLDERYRLAELGGVSVKSFAAARVGGLGFVGAESVIRLVMGLQGIAAMAEKVDRFGS